MQVVTLGLDLAKHVFQVHGVDAEGQVILRRRLRRSMLLAFFEKLPPCLIGMEACATAHHWARQLIALGHQVRLMPATYVKPYVKRGKNDVVDAEAICEAVSRPTMRFVPVKEAEQQSVLMLHRSRDLLIRQRTMLVNALRGHLAEFGFVEAQGLWKLPKLIRLAADASTSELPTLAKRCVVVIVSQLDELQMSITAIDREILAWHRSNEVSRRLETIPGIGVISASAIAATITNPGYFRSGRQLAAWIGLVPRQHGTGGKQRLGRISKQGDRYLRRLLILGATALVRYARGKTSASGWITNLLARRPARVVTVAVANKLARIAWAVLLRGESYRNTARA